MFYRIWCYRWRDLFKTMPAMTLHCTLWFTFNITFSRLQTTFPWLAQGCVSRSDRETSFSSAFAFPLDKSQEFKLALGLQLLCISNSDKSQAAVHKADPVLIPRKAAALLSGLSAATVWELCPHQEILQHLSGYRPQSLC